MSFAKSPTIPVRVLRRPAFQVRLMLSERDGATRSTIIMGGISVMSKGLRNTTGLERHYNETYTSILQVASYDDHTWIFTSVLCN